MDDEWSKGKCSFKMLQYMAIGIPVVVSPIGANKEVIRNMNNACMAPMNSGEWLDALETLYNKPELRASWALIGRQTAKNKYSAKKVAMKLSEIFHEADGDN